MKRNRRRTGRSVLTALATVTRLAVAVAGLVGFALVGVRVVSWVEDHPYFALREIEVQARGPLEAKTLLVWAGVSPGASAWSVDEAEAERRLLAHPRIREAHVERTLPAQVRIRVDERKPVAILLAEHPLLVARDGAVFPALEAEVLDGLPYITGLPGEPPASAVLSQRLRSAARLAELWRQHAPWAGISEIRPDGDDLVAFVTGNPLMVRFSAQASADDFARLSAVLGLWRGRETQLAAIDLSLPGEAVLKLRRASARRAGRADI